MAHELDMTAQYWPKNEAICVQTSVLIELLPIKFQGASRKLILNWHSGKTCIDMTLEDQRIRLSRHDYKCTHKIIVTKFIGLFS